MTYDVQGQGYSETFGHRPDGPLWCDAEECPGVPFQQDANFFEGTEDALDWFVSDANPLRGLLDASADASAIGAGTYDAATDSNVPHTLAGEPVADHLSRYLRTAYAFDGFTCSDMLAGC